MLDRLIPLLERTRCNKSVGGISEVAGSVTRFRRRSFNFAGVQTPTVCLEPLVCRLPPQRLRIPVRADTSPSIRLSGHSIAGTAAPNCTSFCADASEPDSLLPERNPTPDLRGDPLLFNDRELSFLRFQDRVLEEARDETTPLLERVKFLAIVGTHLDDFVRVRAAEVRRNPARRMVVESMVKRLVYRVEVHWRRRMLPGSPIRRHPYRRLPATCRRGTIGSRPPFLHCGSPSDRAAPVRSRRIRSRTLPASA